MEIYFYVLLSFLLGALLAYLFTKNKTYINFQKEKEVFLNLQQASEISKASLEATLTAHQEKTEAQEIQLSMLENKYETQLTDFALLQNNFHTSVAEARNLQSQVADKNKLLDDLRQELKKLREEHSEIISSLATFKASENALKDKLLNQKNEIEKLNEKFKMEFENIANEILEKKTQTFTKLNESNMKTLLDPLGLKIGEFKKQVEDTYGKESNERASLKTEVKNLMLLNVQLASEAKNLTRALKSESKTQGRWGEMILEKILDKSGLRKGEEFFMEHQLFDEQGKALLSAVSGKKMRPDALVKYPEDRHVIIDAKVSLASFIRLTETEDVELQQAELIGHVKSIKNHIDELSAKAYEDYDKSLDFVMMFIPNESAYFAGLQGDSKLWEYAYDKRILLISPTNLIAALKLLSDLWKRERNDRNAVAIADRAVKMYEKMVGFVESLEAVGKNLDTAKIKYDDAVKQLQSGRDNFFSQAGKMKKLLHYKKDKDFSQGNLQLGEEGEETSG